MNLLESKYSLLLVDNSCNILTRDGADFEQVAIKAPFCNFLSSARDAYFLVTFKLSRYPQILPDFFFNLPHEIGTWSLSTMT